MSMDDDGVEGESPGSSCCCCCCTRRLFVSNISLLPSTFLPAPPLAKIGEQKESTMLHR